MEKKKLKKILLTLSVMSAPAIVNETIDNNIAKAEYKNNLYYENGKLANWWYDDGTDWYFFKNGIKLTGKGRDANGERYFANGKYANWWYADGKDWYFFQNGIKHTGKGRDANGERYFVNGKYAEGVYGGKTYKNGIEEKGRGYKNNLYYENGKLANWWYDDGTDWYFFQNGIKHTGKGRDANGERYFVNGKYANGVYDGKTYKDGLEKDSVYKNNLYYVKDKLANWWYDDGTDWYFFQNGIKHTGKGRDANGERYFANGKYANWWYADGKDWYFFQNGIKHTGKGRDANGERYFVNGKYANWWYDDGTDWYFFQNGIKHTGKGRDANGERYFVNGKYANGVYGGKTYRNGIDINFSIKYYAQNDARWGNKFYGRWNLANSGCVPTALAMIVSSYKYDVTPVEIADYLYNNTNFFNKVGPGTYARGTANVLGKYGLSYKVIYSKEQLRNELASGNAVYAAVANSPFTIDRYTHVVVLNGIDSNGNITVYNPYTGFGSKTTHNIDIVWSHASKDPDDLELGGAFLAVYK